MKWLQFAYEVNAVEQQNPFTLSWAKLRYIELAMVYGSIANFKRLPYFDTLSFLIAFTIFSLVEVN